MTGRSRTLAVLAYGVGLVWTGLALWPALVEWRGGGPDVTGSATAPSPRDGRGWFESMRQYCNPVDVATRVRTNPAPAGFDGTAWEAACFALAGRVDEARERIDGLPADGRWRAAGVVFDVVHPAADAGDDMAAGPVMEMVVDYWPNHYMALYHAGAARFQLGAHEQAAGYLERFLQYYDPDDGFRRNAVRMLEDMGR